MYADYHGCPSTYCTGGYPSWALPPFTGKEFIGTVAKEFGVSPGYRVFSRWMVRMAGLFQTTSAELYEMLYQNEFDYLFDSSKFQNAFGVQPVSYLQGIKETVQYYQQ